MSIQREPFILEIPTITHKLSENAFLTYWVSVPKICAQGNSQEQALENFKIDARKYLEGNPVISLENCHQNNEYPGTPVDSTTLAMADPCASDSFPTPFLKEKKEELELTMSKQEEDPEWMPPEEHHETVFLERILKGGAGWWPTAYREIHERVCREARWVNQKTCEADFYDRLYGTFSHCVIFCGDPDKAQDARKKLERDLQAIKGLAKESKRLTRLAEEIVQTNSYPGLTHSDVGGFRKTLIALSWKRIDVKWFN